MSGEGTVIAKRKRPSTGRNENGPPAKKSSRAANGTLSGIDAKEHSRKIIKTIFKRYNLLSSSDADGQDKAFEALIDSCEGDPAARRLAARLVPRFAPRFPDKLESAARALMDLSAWDGSGLEPRLASVAEETRLEALQGLAAICAAAAGQQKPDHRTASSINLHLLRRSQQSKGRTKRAVPVLEQGCIKTSLLQILGQSPRAILSDCFESLRLNSGELFEAAMEALKSFLPEGNHRKNGEMLAEVAEESKLRQALKDHPQLSEWLAAELRTQRGKARNPGAIEILDKLSDHVSFRNSSAGKTRAPLSAIQDQAAMTNGSRTPPKGTPGSSRKPSSRSEAAFPVPSHKPTDRSEEDKMSRQASLAKPSAEDNLTRRPSIKRKFEPQSEHREAGGDQRGRALPTLPSRLLNDRTNGFGRAESGELPQDTSAASMNGAGHARPVLERPPLSSDPPLPGGSCCLTFPCLYISGFQQDLVGEAQIKRECSEYGPVQDVVIFYPRSQALVFFSELRHAIACYKAMNGEQRLARRPLEVQFCEDAPSSNPRNETPARTDLWVALPSPDNRSLDSILRDLAAAGGAEPANTLQVEGRIPGVIMRYASGAAALEAMRLLRGSRLAMGASPSRRSVSPPPRRFAARRSRSRSPPRRSPRRRSPPRLTPPRRGSPSRRSPPRFRARDLPEYASCTLWIGQVGPDVDERELIQSFERHGTVVGYKLLRGSMCGFIDFERVEEAASARSALHEAKFADCEIRVEYKELMMMNKAFPQDERHGTADAWMTHADLPIRHRKEEGRALGRLGYAPPPRGRGGRGFRGMSGRGRGRFDDFEPRRYGPRGGRPFYDGSPPQPSAYRGGFGRGRGRMMPFDRDDFQFRQGRSRSPMRGSSPSRQSWSPPRSPVILRREVRGRYGGSSQDGRRSPRSRNTSVEPAYRQRSGSPRLAAIRRDPAEHRPDRVQRSGWSDGPMLPDPPQPSGNGPVDSSTQRWPWPNARGTAIDGEVAIPAEAANAQASPLSPQPSAAAPLPQSGPANSQLLVEHARQGVPTETPTWSGKLAKSGSVVCSIQCMEGPRQEAGGANGLEPLNWPSTLDVTLRIDIKFKDFCSYLTGRGRAGVVQAIPAAGRLPERNIYLIPPSEAVATCLKIRYQPRPHMLLAFTVPAHLKF